MLRDGNLMLLLLLSQLLLLCHLLGFFFGYCCFGFFSLQNIECLVLSIKAGKTIPETMLSKIKSHLYDKVKDCFVYVFGASGQMF